jgi:hypothetical protein
VRGNAEVLVTFNTRDFPEESTSAYDITIVHPDDFLLDLLDLLDLYPGDVMSALRTQASGYKNPEMGVQDLLGRLAAGGVTRFAAEARRHL